MYAGKKEGSRLTVTSSIYSIHISKTSVLLVYDPVCNKYKEGQLRMLFQCCSIDRSVLGGVMCTGKTKMQY